MPIVRSGRDVAAAGFVIEIDDVLLGRIVSRSVARSSCRKSSSFVATCSVAASIARSTSNASPSR